jgi:hypothetical protein
LPVSSFISSFFIKQISSKLEAADKFASKKLGLMYRDECGVLEPQTDILSTALAVIGFVVFVALLSQAYLGYEARAFALENYESASLLANTLAADPYFRSESSSMISAASLDKLSGPEGIKQREGLFASFSGNYQFFIEIRTQEELWRWRIEPANFEPDSFAEGREKVAASVPVVIELNPAKSVPGVLSVVVCKTAWK